MMPKWIEKRRKLSDTYGYVHDKPLYDALSIAWEALGEVVLYSNDPIIVFKTKEVIAEIRKLGGGE